MLEIVLALLLLSILFFVFGGHYSDKDSLSGATMFIGILTATLFYRERGWFGFGYSSEVASPLAFAIFFVSGLSCLLLELLFVAPLRERRRISLPPNSTLPPP